MSISTSTILGDDGKSMTQDQIEISRLKKSNTALQQEQAEIKQRIEKLEKRIEYLETKPNV